MPWAGSGAAYARYWAVRLEGGADAVEAMAAFLLEFGVGGVEWEDGAPPSPSFADFVPAQAAIPHVTAYFPDDDRWADRAGQIAERAAESGWHLEVRAVASEDWENAWKAYYVPISLSEGYGVVPAWFEESPYRVERTIWLDPGMAFGTGAHPTTRSCLSLLIEYGASRRRVLDLGSGSGILAIAAARLGARRIWAVEPDPVAVRALEANVRMNHVGARVRVVPGTFADLPPALRFDLVLMNLIRELIVPLWPNVAPRVEGSAVLSGLLDEAVEEVEAVVRATGFRVQEYRFREGWATLRVVR